MPVKIVRKLYFDQVYFELEHDALSFLKSGSPENKFGKHCSRVPNVLKCPLECAFSQQNMVKFLLECSSTGIKCNEVPSRELS